MGEAKRTAFIGSSLADLRAFPERARREAGFQLDRVQNGFEPSDWKPMRAIGPGVLEIRVHDAAGQFRVIYVAKFASTVYILHCFQKKEQKTSAKDVAIAADRYRELVRELER